MQVSWVAVLPGCACLTSQASAGARSMTREQWRVDLRHNFGGIGAWVAPFVTGLGSSEFNA